MTRLSKREIERTLEGLGATDDGPDRIEMKDTVVGTSWPGDDMAPGETETTVTEIEL